MVREIYENELSKLLNLYLYLHEKSVRKGRNIKNDMGNDYKR